MTSQLRRGRNVTSSLAAFTPTAPAASRVHLNFVILGLDPRSHAGSEKVNGHNRGHCPRILPRNAGEGNHAKHGGGGLMERQRSRSSLRQEPSYGQGPEARLRSSALCRPPTDRPELRQRRNKPWSDTKKPGFIAGLRLLTNLWLRPEVFDSVGHAEEACCRTDGARDSDAREPGAEGSPAAQDRRGDRLFLHP